MAFRWRADDRPLLVVFGSSLLHYLKKKCWQRCTPLWQNFLDPCMKVDAVQMKGVWFLIYPLSAHIITQGAQWLSGIFLDLSLTGVTALRSLSKTHSSLVLVQPRKTRPCFTERLLMGRKNQINQTRYDYKEMLKIETMVRKQFNMQFSINQWTILCHYLIKYTTLQ